MVLLIRLSLTLITNCIICYLEHGDETLHEDKAKKKINQIWSRVGGKDKINPSSKKLYCSDSTGTHTHTSKTETQTQTNTSL